jgi:sterol desaturase/sphingolipid hydroxylase (fatty acid hydroxylase superfamily)
MDWTVPIGESCLSVGAWMTVLAVVFALLARWMPCNRGMYWWKRPQAAATDLLYWFVSPLLARLGRALLLAAGAAMLFGGGPVGWPAVNELPLWQQVVLVLLLEDLILYWAHRAFHTRPGWRFHAIHHSPEVLDWSAAARFHLVNDLLCFVLADVVVLLIGFSPATLLLLAPFNTAYGSMVHANLNWTFGPLRYVFASPVFHRWHHTSDRDGMDRNFASTFPFLDLLFGTFYMPPQRLPEHFGNGEQDFPESFWGQFLHPFRKRPPMLSAELPTRADSLPQHEAA